MVTARYVGEVDDSVLEALDAREALFDPMGGSPEGGDANAVDTSLPWELEVPPPVAVDLRPIYATVPPSLPGAAAAAEPALVVLLRHALTAFARPGEKPPRVWGMGYTVRLVGVDDAATLSLAPDSAADAVASASGHVDVGLGAGGRLGLTKLLSGALAPALAALPVLPIPDVTLKASADTQFTAGFRLDIRALQIQAGPVGAGGAQWNLYRHRRDFTRTQALFHTVTLPPGTSRLTVRVETWIRQKTQPWGHEVSQWCQPETEYDIPIR